MSIAKALSNAVSGLTATSRGTETIAANVANVLTPGYARREMALSAVALGGQSGGVRVDGISRMVNSALLAETQLATAARSSSDDLAAFFKRAEEAIGLPGDAGAISTALTQFESALISASARPDEDLRLGKVVETAGTLVDRLKAVSSTIQKARTAADISIGHQVDNLQRGLQRIAHLNRQIASLSSGNQDIAALQDERQAVVDGIADILPLRIISRDFGRISLFTAEGAPLLDGLVPTQISFTPAGEFTPDRQFGTPGVSGLTVNGEEISGSGLRLFAGGSLGAAFAIRDTHAPQIQSELDTLAHELCRRFADPATDPTLTSGQPGLFTDGGAAAGPPPSLGLAATLAINEAVLPAAGGALWRLRSGLQAMTPGPVGDASLIGQLSDALKAVHDLAPPSPISGRHDTSGFAATLEAQVASRRLSAEADASLHGTRAATLSERLMAEGVDTDSEMQRLLQYEQAYAANARVIQAIDEMMNTILRV